MLAPSLHSPVVAPLGPKASAAPHSADAVARLCRRIALRFVHGATRGWSRDELAHWLREHRDIASHVDGPRGDRAHWDGHTGEDREETRAQVELALAVVREVVALLSDPARGPTTLADLTLAGLVVPFVDRAGRQGFMPTHWSSMTIADRALSLVAVVYAVRPIGFDFAADFPLDGSMARSPWAAMPKVPVELLGARQLPSASLELLVP
jgi:hypothetical protein